MTHTGWDKVKIKYELSRAGWPYFRDIDRKFGLPVNTTHNAITRPDPRVEKIISDILGVPAHVIWPSRYDANGVRLRPQPAASYTPVPVRGHGQKMVAA